MLPKIEFNRDKVSTINCFKNQEAIDKNNKKGDANAYLPKVEETYGKVIFPTTRDYPYSFASIALSMDGKMAYHNRPEGILIAKSNSLNEDGALTDFYVLNFLRAYADVAINGTKTLVSEPNMWMTIYDEDLIAERRENLGKKRSHPSNVIITLDGTDVPFEHQIFNQKSVPISLFSTPEGCKYIEEHASDKFYLLAHAESIEDINGSEIEEGLSQLGGKIPIITTGGFGKTDISLYMALLKKAGMGHILIESPTFMWLLMKEKLMDEIFITHTTTFVGGTLSPGYDLPFTFENHPQSEIIQLNRHDNSFIFTRQKICYSEGK